VILFGPPFFKAIIAKSVAATGEDCFNFAKEADATLFIFIIFYFLWLFIAQIFHSWQCLVHY
jgi:hypothetical protein